MTATESIPTAPPPSHRGRRILAGLALVLACLSLVGLVLTTWTRATLLDTERFTAVVERVTTQPEITNAVARRLSLQIVTALDLNDRFAGFLPGEGSAVANALTEAIRSRLEIRLADLLQDPRFQDAWVDGLAFAHSQALLILRDEHGALLIDDGYLYLDVLPFVGRALEELQAIGLLPADVVLPDLGDPDGRETAIENLEARLQRDLPPDFGLVQLISAERIEALGGYVRLLDLILVVLVAATVGLALAAVALARDRRRMVVFVGLAAVIALVLARLALRGFETAAIAWLSDGQPNAPLSSIVSTTVDDLVAFTTIFVLAALALVTAAVLIGRREAVTASAGRARGAAAGAGAAVRGAGGSTGAGLQTVVRERRQTVERVGLAVVAFVVLWYAIGLDAAVVGLVLVGGWLVLVNLLAGDRGEATAPTGRPAPTEATAPIEASAATEATAPTEAPRTTFPPDA